MNSQTEKQPNSTPVAPATTHQKEQQQYLELYAEYMKLTREKVLMAKAVWLLLVEHNCTHGNTHLIDEDALPYLWNLRFTADEKERLVIKAELLPEMTDEQIQHVVEFLLGTKHTLYDAIEKHSLPQPPEYVEAVIRPFLVLYKSVWIAPPIHQPDAN